MTEYTNILVEQRGRVGLVTLNRPEALNALDKATMDQLVAAVTAMDADPGVGAVVVTGSVKAFAAGADIKEMQAKGYPEMYAADWFRGWEDFTRLRIPVIAAVSGFALGGGCELAMMCDFIIAGDNAKFRQPEINLGVVPGMGGSQRLTRAVGKAKAMDMILTGRFIGAEEAERSGLVSRVVPAADVVDEALKAAAGLAARYVTDRFMPDKAIDLIDEAASRVRMYRSASPPSLKEAMRGLEALRNELEAAIAAQDFDLASALRDRERKLKERISGLEKDWKDEQQQDEPVVTEEDIAQVVSMWTGIPLTRIAGEESERLLQMESALHERVVAQEEAINTLSKAVRRARAGLKDPKRPIGSFIFLGPTGVGKSELAKALAEFMFGAEDALIKIDMSEFMERHNVSRLVGAPPGYVGYDEGGQLTEAVRRKSYSVILLDEIEKAHPEAFNMLLQILEDGNLADAKGRRVDFRNTIIIMTSNVGAEAISRELTLGFVVHQDETRKQKSEYDKMKDKVLEQLKKTFKPEFLNRIDGVIVFHSLTREHIRLIVDIQLARVRKQLVEKEITLEISDEAMDKLGEDGYDHTYGARPLRRLIQNVLEDPLAEGLLDGRFHPGHTVRAEVEDGEFRLREVEALVPVS